MRSDSRMEISFMGGGSAAEDDFIVSASGAGEGAGGVVFCIAVSLRAFALEETRIVSRRATLQKRPRAAILRCIESNARALASVGHPQFFGALGIYIAAAGTSCALRIGGYDRHWQVESVDQRDVIEVKVIDLIEGILDQSCKDSVKFKLASMFGAFQVFC